MSSPTIKDKPVQIRPWRLSDADFVLDASMPLDPRKTVFVGGVPRPLKAGELIERFLLLMIFPLHMPTYSVHQWHIKFYALFIVIVELAMIMDRLYGGVCYAGIDTDPELKYPKVRILSVRPTHWC